MITQEQKCENTELAVCEILESIKVNESRINKRKIHWNYSLTKDKADRINRIISRVSEKYQVNEKLIRKILTI